MLIIPFIEDNSFTIDIITFNRFSCIISHYIARYSFLHYIRIDIYITITQIDAITLSLITFSQTADTHDV